TALSPTACAVRSPAARSIRLRPCSVCQSFPLLRSRCSLCLCGEKKNFTTETQSTQRSHEDSELFQLAQFVADLRRFLEVEILCGVLHFLRQAADRFVDVFVAEVEFGFRRGAAGDLEVVE